MTALFYEGKHVRVESHTYGVKKLILTRPDIRNAFHEEMITELLACLDQLRSISSTDEMRLLTISGEGRVFCAGADLNYMKQQSEKTHEDNLKDARFLGKLFFDLSNFPTPVLAIVQGAAIGGGFGLVSCSDVVICDSECGFATSEVLLGIIPAVISPYIIRKIGVGKSSPFMLSGQRLTAQEAFQLGLVHIIADNSSLLMEVEKITYRLLQAGPEAARKTKGLLKECYPLPNYDIQEFTAQQIATTRCSHEAKEGLCSFFQKTKPTWAANKKG